MKIIDTNKKAYFDYEILDTFEAGIVLSGAEVKSVARGDINLRDGFCHFTDGELYLKNCHITPYDKGSYFNLEAARDRKLLLHKYELRRLIGKIKEKGLTLVPLKIYMKGSLVKLEIGLGKGKKLFDKKQSIKERDLDRHAEREIKDLR